MAGKEAAGRAKNAYLPETYRRLLDLKAKYDPENLLRFSYQLVTPEFNNNSRGVINKGAEFIMRPY